MGPSGCGKTTLARAVAEALQLRFVEGDELHSSANVAKMRAGRPLDDADRGPWLDAIAGALRSDGERGVVASCSALKRRYRDRLRAAAGPVVFILPVVPREMLACRLAERSGHYMPPGLLESQLADLEELEADEPGFRTDGATSVESQLGFICSRLPG